MSARAALYKLARWLGDVQAVASGRIAPRLVRKALGRLAGGYINRLFK